MYEVRIAWGNHEKMMWRSCCLELRRINKHHVLMFVGIKWNVTCTLKGATRIFWCKTVNKTPLGAFCKTHQKPPGIVAFVKKLGVAHFALAFLAALRSFRRQRGVPESPWAVFRALGLAAIQHAHTQGWWCLSLKSKPAGVGRWIDGYKFLEVWKISTHTCWHSCVFRCTADLWPPLTSHLQQVVNVTSDTSWFWMHVFPHRQD